MKKTMTAMLAAMLMAGTVSAEEFDLSKARRLIGFDPQCDIVRMIDEAIAFRNGQDIGVLPVA